MLQAQQLKKIALISFISMMLVFGLPFERRLEAKPIHQAETPTIFLPVVLNTWVRGSMLFADDFEDRTFTFTHWTQDGGMWDISDGRYYCYYLTGGSHAGDTSWDNYIFYVDVLGVNIVDKIVQFRYLDPNEAYGINLRSDLNDIVLVKNYPGKDPQVLADVHKVNYNDAWYSLKIVLLDSRIQIFVNDVLTVDYTDTTSPILHGKIGIGGMLRPESKVYFDNVKVYSIQR